MINKKIKNIVLSVVVTAALCAGTVSARQMSRAVATTTCRGFCTKSVPCPNILGCACVFQQPQFPNSGVCGLIAARPAR